MADRRDPSEHQQTHWSRYGANTSPPPSTSPPFDAQYGPQGCKCVCASYSVGRIQCMLPYSKYGRWWNRIWNGTGILGDVHTQQPEEYCGFDKRVCVWKQLSREYWSFEPGNYTSTEEAGMVTSCCIYSINGINCKPFSCKPRNNLF